MVRFNRNFSQPIEAPSIAQTSVAIAYGIFGTAPFLFAPFLIGALIAAQWSEASAGSLLTIELIGASLGSAASFFARSRISPTTALLWTMIAHGLSGIIFLSFPGEFAPLSTIRGFAGLGEGFCLSAAYGFLSRGKEPDRLFAILLVATLLVSALGLWAIPIILDAIQLQGLFWILAGIGLILAAAAHQSRSDAVSMEKADRPLRITARLFAALAAVWLFFGGQGMIWAFIEQIGLKNGIEHTDIGAALAISSITGLAAAGIATVLGGRLGQRWPVAFGLVLTLPFLALLGTKQTLEVYTLIACALQFNWCFATPYIMSGLTLLSDSKRLIALGVTLQLVGFGIGPALGGFVIELESGFSGTLYLAAGMAILSALLAVMAYKPNNGG